MTLMLTPAKHQTLRDEMVAALTNARPPRRRSLLDFAESEIVIPTGPFATCRFSAERQPFVRLLYDVIDNPPPDVNRFFCTGPAQSGKTLCTFVIPIMYHLFEHREDVIVGVPLGDMAGDKWTKDIEPAIASSRYRDLLPTAGKGARGGTSNLISIRFAHGPTLRFMSGGSQVKGISGYTCRVIVLTEIDGYSSLRDSSNETDPMSHMEARSDAFGTRKRIYGECTLSTEQGRIHREVTTGYDGPADAPYHAKTTTRIGLPCPHCRQYVTPELEHFVGPAEAKTVREAAEIAAFHCPACGVAWTEPERNHANHHARLLWRGQSIDPDTGLVTGPAAGIGVDTVGFRWSQVNNLLPDCVRQLAIKEFKYHQLVNNESEAVVISAGAVAAQERERCQLRWAIPHIPPALETTPLQFDVLAKRVAPFARGFCPPEVRELTVGIDLRKNELHFTATAHMDTGWSHIVDYGVLMIPSREMGVEQALLATLREFRDTTLAEGWAIQGTTDRLPPVLVLVDAGWQGGPGTANQVVYAFCAESNSFAGLDWKRFRFLPSLGRGAGQQYFGRYSRPKTTGATVPAVGESCHLAMLPNTYGSVVVEFDADAWKTTLHSRLSVPIFDESNALKHPIPPAALTLYATEPRNHTQFIRHLLAEKQVTEFKPGQGEVTYWERVNPQNHWLDTTSMSLLAGHLALGSPAVTPVPAPAPSAKQPEAPREQGPYLAPIDPDRPFLVTER